MRLLKGVQRDKEEGARLFGIIMAEGAGQWRCWQDHLKEDRTGSGQK